MKDHPYTLRLAFEPVKFRRIGGQFRDDVVGFNDLDRSRDVRP